jgi:hypothetical protein
VGNVRLPKARRAWLTEPMAASTHCWHVCSTGRSAACAPAPAALRLSPQTLRPATAGRTAGDPHRPT